MLEKVVLSKFPKPVRKLASAFIFLKMRRLTKRAAGGYNPERPSDKNPDNQTFRR